MASSVFIAAASVAAIVLFGGTATKAQSILQVSPTGNLTDDWQAEPGQSIPTGVVGWVGGTLLGVVAGSYKFTFGPNYLPGATGYGNASNINEFWIGPDRLTAEANGWFFCNRDCTGALGNALPASTVGQSFDVALPVGPIPFGFAFDQGAGPHTLLNGQRNDANGAYMVTTADSFANLSNIPNAGPNAIAVIGLTDNQFSQNADHDFQDLTVQVSVPEPLSLVALGLGIGALGLVRRKRIA